MTSDKTREAFEAAEKYLDEHHDYSKLPHSTAKDAYIYHLVEAITKASTPQWQDISSAPKDGTSFLVSRTNAYEGDVSIVAWCDERIRDTPRFEGTGGFILDTTRYIYWQPLPSPPEEK